MRITGGEFRGRRIRPPRSRAVRPTMDRMRESAFATLGGIEGRRFLDLFSGTGVVAAEAASRGAAVVVAVDRDRANRALIEGNVAFADDRVSVRSQSCEAFVCRERREMRERGRRRWDYIFADPPFAYRRTVQLVADIAGGELLAAAGRLLLHVPSQTAREALLAAAAPLGIVDERSYGGSTLYQFAAEVVPTGEPA